MEVVEPGWLPDLSGMTLAEVLESQDPVIVAAADRVREQLLRGGPGVEVTQGPAYPAPAAGGSV